MYGAPSFSTTAQSHVSCLMHHAEDLQTDRQTTPHLCGSSSLNSPNSQKLSVPMTAFSDGKLAKFFI